MNENQNPYESPVVLAEMVEPKASKGKRAVGWFLAILFAASALSCLPEPYLTIALLILCVVILAAKTLPAVLLRQ